MRTWLLASFDESERLYQGNLGYADDLRSVYKYDSFVPNHTRINVGDSVIIRGKTQVQGSAVIERLVVHDGEKVRRHCPSCNATKIKERRVMTPRFRCECGMEFDTPVLLNEPCRLYEAHFGDTYEDLQAPLEIPQLWEIAPKLNKQLAMLELDSARAAELLADVARSSSLPKELPRAASQTFSEGSRTTVVVNRYERDARARRECINHYGWKCVVCEFDFAVVYGDLGKNVIEVHHLELLASGDGPKDVDPIRDLRPLCPNCHTIVHRSNPPMSVEALRELLLNRARSAVIA